MCLTNSSTQQQKDACFEPIVHGILPSQRTSRGTCLAFSIVPDTLLFLLCNLDLYECLAPRTKRALVMLYYFVNGPGDRMTTSIETLLTYQQKLLSFLETRVPSKEIAQDLLHTALLKVLDHPEKLPEEKRLLPWFYQVLRNSVVDFYRRQHTQKQSIRHYETEVLSQPSDSFFQQTPCSCMNELIPTLSLEYSDILQVVDLKEQQLQKYAQTHGIRANNATVRLHRARQALRRQLEHHCGVCAKEGCLDCECSPKQKRL